MIRVRKLKAIQEKIAKEVTLDAEVRLKDGMHVAGFDCAVAGDELICAGVVLEYPSLRIVEHNTITRPAPIPFLPTLFAFREGPLILELYYNLENDPSIILIDGHGVAHPDSCGLATYVGVELHKPTIGVAKNLLAGTVEDTTIQIDGKIRGTTVQTKEHAKALFVSPGNLISIADAATITQQLVVPPHKLPEPLHIAHRLATKARKEHVSQEEKST